jgi:putative SOS response-associated peptidase YedK
LTAICRCTRRDLTSLLKQIASANIPVIIRDESGNRCRLMHWGLIPHWAKDPTIGNRMINARAETLIEKPAFKHLTGKPPLHYSR